MLCFEEIFKIFLIRDDLSVFHIANVTYKLHIEVVLTYFDKLNLL